MTRSSTLSCVLVALSVVPAGAQITFDAAYYMAQRGKTLASTTYQMSSLDATALAAMTTTAGGGQTFDFSGFAYDAGALVSFPVLSSAAGTPGENDPEFGGANYVTFQDYGGGYGFWSFVNVSEEGYDYIGSIYLVSDGEQVNKNTPPDRVYALPLTAGSMWDQSIVVNTVSFGTESSLPITEHNEVEAWGTLITPMGTAPCIRMRKTRVDQVPAKRATTTDSYFFITNGNVSASISYNSAIEGPLLATYSRLGGIGTSTEEIPISDFDLLQNYPNPFSGSTTISFQLDHPAYAKLDVFDLMGREVKSLVDAQLGAGIHRADLDGSTLADGVYFYRLDVDGGALTRKLLVRRD